MTQLQNFWPERKWMHTETRTHKVKKYWRKFHNGELHYCQSS